MAKFNGICILTRNVAGLRDFYRDLLQAEAAGDDVFGSVSVNGAHLTFFYKEGMEQMAPGSVAELGSGNIVLEFEVDHVDKEYQRALKRGIPIVKPPTTQAWGLRSVWLRDPDGNIVNLFCQAVGMNEKSFSYDPAKDIG